MIIRHTKRFSMNFLPNTLELSCVLAFHCSMVYRLALVFLAGCVATVTPPPSRGIVASGPPPAPLAEQPSPPPPPQQGRAPEWQAGYWHWTGVEYAWIPGHWEAPRQGLTWSRPRYWNESGRTLYRPGAWVRP